jgi:hypothetical protein
MSPRRFYDLRMGTVDFLVGKSVTEIRYFGQTDIRIVFDPGEKSEPALYADMSTPVLGTRDGATYAVSPKDPASVGPVLAIVGQEVEGAVIEDGALTLGLSDGSKIRCEPDDRYEAWQVVGGTPEHLVICMPGGEIAVWTD